MAILLIPIELAKSLVLALHVQLAASVV